MLHHSYPHGGVNIFILLLVGANGLQVPPSYVHCFVLDDNLSATHQEHGSSAHHAPSSVTFLSSCCWWCWLQAVVWPPLLFLLSCCGSSSTLCYNAVVGVLLLSWCRRLLFSTIFVLNWPGIVFIFLVVLFPMMVFCCIPHGADCRDVTIVMDLALARVRELVDGGRTSNTYLNEYLVLGTIIDSVLNMRLKKVVMEEQKQSMNFHRTNCQPEMV